MSKSLNRKKIDLQVLNGIADLIRVLDENEKVVFVNQAMEEMLGYDSKQLVCSIGSDVFNPSITKRVLQTGEVIQREENIANLIFSVKCSPIIGENGEIIGIVEVFRNVTMARKLQNEMIKKNKAMTSETNAASKIQRTMLPDRGFQKNLKVNYLYMPSNILSGDMFDVFEIDEDHIALYIADSVGHGFAASMVTMFIKSMIRTSNISIMLSPKEMLRSISDRFTTLKLDIENYFTCFYGVYNRKKNTFTYSNAGHLPLPMRIRDGQIEKLVSSGYPISRFFSNPKYEEYKIDVFAGDKLLFMTDGIVENRNRNGDYFGIERVEEVVKVLNIDVLDTLEKNFKKFLDGPQTDDVSALIVNVW